MRIEIKHDHSNDRKSTISRLSSLSDSTGTLESYTYLGLGTLVNCYGKRTVLSPTFVAASDTFVFNHGFAGGKTDTVTSRVNFRNREYDVDLMRWTTMDPIGFAAGDMNWYQYVEAGPTGAVDPSGLYFGYDDAAFILGGAVLGLGSQAVGDLFNGQLSGWEDYAGSAVGGAVNGELVLYTGPVAAGLGGGASGNATKQLLKLASGRQNSLDPMSFVAETAVGGAVGVIPGGKIPGVTSGRRSHLQVYNQLTDKAEKGLAKNLTTRTAAKMLSGRFTEKAMIEPVEVSEGLELPSLCQWTLAEPIQSNRTTVTIVNIFPNGIAPFAFSCLSVIFLKQSRKPNGPRYFSFLSEPMHQSLSQQSFSHRMTILLFASTIFISAFLLFQVQPIMGKYILPWYGGSPGVWTTCMLVFQVLLFGGYAYAHALNRFLGLRMQIALHCGLLLLATSTLPITPSSDWKPTGGESPTAMIMLLLMCKVGAPYFLLSSTGPLLQSWLGQSKILEQPYRLYSLSNVGSMLALLSFPFVIEPALSSSEQSYIWSIAFAVFAVACSLSGLALFHSSKRTPLAATASVDVESHSVTWNRVATWFGLAMLPSVMLLATTNQVCLDAGVIPFLWVIPLAIYLLSFILTFDSERWYSRRPCIMMATVSFLILFVLKLIEYQTPLLVELTLYFSGLLFSCMVCHGELVAIKPHAQKLTLFYMTMSAGGAFGGIFVGLLSPVLFTGYFEWQLSLFVCVLVFLDIYLQSNSFWANRVSATSKLIGAISFPVLAVVWLSAWTSFSNNQIVAKRNFYGVLSVANSRDAKSGMPTRNMVHGRIIHGSQFQEPEFKQNPSTYFTPSSGIGIALLNHQADQPRHIGVVGLGAGVLATYGKKGDRIRYYEINDNVVQLAKEYFTFLKETPASVEVILGDARLALEREEAQYFDVLVLDAFTGDAIPVHLLMGNHGAIHLGLRAGCGFARI